MSAKADTRSESFLRYGRSGTADIAMWSGDTGKAMTGSSDLYQHDGRHPTASVNFITAHDGFTLHDLVTYNRKHNEANGEENRDGTNDNHSYNYGLEGETDDAHINETRG